MVRSLLSAFDHQSSLVWWESVQYSNDQQQIKIVSVRSMYQCAIPPRVFLAVGVGLLIFSLVLGWISFSVPDWLQFYERSLFTNVTLKNNQSTLPLTDEQLSDLKKFGLWYKCTFSSISNDFICTLWNKDAPSTARQKLRWVQRIFIRLYFCSGFVQVAQVLIPMGLSFGCLSFLLAIVGFMSRRAFVTSVLFAALFAFLGCKYRWTPLERSTEGSNACRSFDDSRGEWRRESGHTSDSCLDCCSLSF